MWYCVFVFFVVVKGITKENPSASTLASLSSVSSMLYNYRSNQPTSDLNANIRTGGCLILQLVFPSYCLPLCGSWSAVMCYICNFVCTCVYVFHLSVVIACIYLACCVIIYLSYLWFFMYISVFIHTICSIATSTLPGWETNLTSITLIFLNSWNFLVWLDFVLFLHFLSV